MAADADDCFTKPTEALIACSLGHKLIRVVDKANDLLTRFGLRTYSVRIIHTTWTGPRRGTGSEQVVRETMLLPVPEISSMAGVRKQPTSVGLDEVGSINVTKISGRYTEDEVFGTIIKGVPYDPVSDQVFYEVTFIRRGEQVRRRFSVDGVPSYTPEDFAWSISLKRANEDRDDLTGDPT